MSDVTLADLAARRKALAEMALGIAHGFAPRYRGLHDECLPAVESALVQAQRDLCEVLKAEVWALQGRYSTDDSHTCP